MSNKVKYYAVKSYEWLLPTGDASKILVLYSIADDDQGIQNAKDLSMVINLSRTAEIGLVKRNASLGNKTNQEKILIEYLRGEIKKAIISGSELSSEMTITSYENKIPTNPAIIELRLGEWEKIIIDRKFGFLSS